ncbi:hypothetical protein [Pelomonas sp. KK5]|uniref:hypothetical protein n=1 Tax=Pelomonas sp. KK5 TaxID=1855730 RepID=UPI00097C60CF|nr:hypothetical protein [Pelomonas sp. KK5]
MRTQRRSARLQAGYTLVELAFAGGLLGSLSAVAGLMWVDSLSTVSAVETDNAGIAQARYAMERLAREIRQVKWGTTGSAYCITTFTSSQLVYRRTSNGSSYDPTCGTGDLLVTVALSGSAVNLAYSASPAASSNIAADVNSFALSYLDSSLTVTNSAASIRYVQITLTMKPASGQTTTLRTLVALRNTYL